LNSLRHCSLLTRRLNPFIWGDGVIIILLNLCFSCLFRHIVPMSLMLLLVLLLLRCIHRYSFVCLFCMGSHFLFFSYCGLHWFSVVSVVCFSFFNHYGIKWSPSGDDDERHKVIFPWAATKQCCRIWHFLKFCNVLVFKLTSRDARHTYQRWRTLQPLCSIAQTMRSVSVLWWDAP